MENKPHIAIAPHAQTRVVLMHAKAIQTMAQFYTDIQVGLQIPAYFGRNLDALEETLADLMWIEEPHTLLIIYRSELLLKTLPNERESLLLVLKACNNPALDILFL
jgi:RNAse (barnase) inhibitor barstar